MRKKLIILFLFLIFPFFVSAYTKEDILNLVENQKLCDKQTEALYDRYFKMYSRLLKTKDIDQNGIDTIYQNLTTVLDIIKKENICSVDDLDKISAFKKAQIYNYLYNSSKLIIKAPDLKNTETSVKYNDDDTIDVYENGEYLDTVALSKTTFNYVGLSALFVSLKYLLPISLIFILINIFITKNKKIINNILIIIFTCLLIGNIFYFTLGSFSYDMYYLIKSMNYKENTNIVKMEVKNKKIIKYPTYGSEFAKLKINDLGINLPIYYGESKAILTKGIGFVGSFPGFKGTIILSGHNSKQYLNKLKDIKIDNKIILETNYGQFNYQVSKMEILGVNEYTSLEKNDKVLIIYTCYPFDELVYSDKRFVIYANLIKEDWSK